jgi:hypothetical protein
MLCITTSTFPENSKRQQQLSHHFYLYSVYPQLPLPHPPSDLGGGGGAGCGGGAGGTIGTQGGVLGLGTGFLLNSSHSSVTTSSGTAIAAPKRAKLMKRARMDFPFCILWT